MMNEVTFSSYGNKMTVRPLVVECRHWQRDWSWRWCSTITTQAACHVVRVTWQA